MLPAFFDSRCFNVPREEVNNYFLWRQANSVSNSIQGFAQLYFGHEALDHLNCNQIQEKLWQEKSVNWNDLPVWQKRGWCQLRSGPDYSPPIFSQEPEYINKHVYLEPKSETLQ
jgi:tRNA(His) 5'-end guanylyltransferase